MGRRKKPTKEELMQALFTEKYDTLSDKDKEYYHRMYEEMNQKEGC